MTSDKRANLRRLILWMILELGVAAVFLASHRNFFVSLLAAAAILTPLLVIVLHLREYENGRQLESHLEIARRVQADLLPSTQQRVLEGFDVAADCFPASSVGGDFYDVFPTPTGSAFVLGDVAGKGIPAALLMGVLYGAVRSSAWTESPLEHEAATTRINRLLCDRASRERYATMFWAYFDLENRRLSYINAGHLSPLLFKGDRRRTVLRLRRGGPPLGLLPGASFQQGSARMDPGDILVLYSDGVVETMDTDGEQFGEARLQAAVTNSFDGSARQIRNGILSSLTAFGGDAIPADDRTLLVVRHVNPAVRSSVDEREMIAVA